MCARFLPIQRAAWAAEERVQVMVTLYRQNASVASPSAAVLSHLRARGARGARGEVRSRPWRRSCARLLSVRPLALGAVCSRRTATAARFTSACAAHSLQALERLLRRLVGFRAASLRVA